jgi:ArsR family transcriptional regulator
MNDTTSTEVLTAPCDSLDIRNATPEESDEELAGLAKAIAHPVRLQIIRFLSGRSTCFCGEIVEQLPLAQSTVSEHLRILKEAGLIKGEIDGPRVCYCLEPKSMARLRILIDSL